MNTKFLVVISLILMPFVFAACGDDKPEYDYPEYPNYPSEDKEESVDFSNLYGYWLNSDKTGAMAISEYSKTQCRILYYAFSLDNPRRYEQESYYSNNGTFTALVPVSNGCYNEIVKISLSSYNKIILTHYSGNGYSTLSSYIFSRVSESEFFDYLENGGSSGSQSGDDEEEDKLFGTWKGKDDEWIIKLTFYPSGKAVEEWSDGYYSDVTTGTYTYSNGKITKWDMEDGSALCNTIGDCPWPVVFSSSTSMTLGSGYSKITFTKQ